MLFAFLGTVLLAMSLYVPDLGLTGVIVGLVMIGLGMTASIGAGRSAAARASQRRYWAHYYDEDQVEQRRRCGQKQPPAPYHDEIEEYIFFDSIFDDD